MTDGPSSAGEPDNWRPANETELFMYHALIRGASDRYFEEVAKARLHLACIEGDPAADRPRQLVTWRRDGREHLLAFTSPEALARCVGTDADTVVIIDYPDLLRDWPDPDWWLAINPTLPIDASLPIEAVGEAARGEIDIPLAERPESFDTLPEIDDLPDVDVYPVNELERALAEALLTGSMALVVDVLITAEVLLPTLEPVGDGYDLDDPAFPWCALPLSANRPVEELAIGVFTSPERLAEAAAGALVPTVSVGLIHASVSWPSTEYAMIVNPGSPLRARLEGDQVVALLAWARIAAMYHGVDLDAPVET